LRHRCDFPLRRLSYQALTAPIAAGLAFTIGETGAVVGSDIAVVVVYSLRGVLVAAIFQ